MFNHNSYEKYILDLIYYFDPIRLDQLTLALQKNFNDVDKERAIELVMRLQKNGYILVTQDSWVITKGRYLQLSNDSRYSKVKYDESETRLPDIEHLLKDKEKHLKLIDGLWILIDMLPYSNDFVLTNKPFQLTWTSSKTKKLYQLIVINSDEEDSRIELLKSLPNDYYEEFKNSIRRIALIENPDHAWKIPEGMGFKHILTKDDTCPEHYRVVEKREKVW